MAEQRGPGIWLCKLIKVILMVMNMTKHCDICLENQNKKGSLLNSYETLAKLNSDHYEQFNLYFVKKYNEEVTNRILITYV